MGAKTVTFVAGLAVVLTVGCGGDDDPETTTETTSPAERAAEARERARERVAQDLEAAGIDPASGNYKGLRPDLREGAEAAVPQISAVSVASAAREAGCDLRTGLPDEGRTHLAPTDPAPVYRTNPPTSGDHAVVPTADGAYLTTPPERDVVHSLEHGRIAIQYDPRLPERQQLLLKGIFEADPRGMLLFPNPRMPYAVAATAWTDLLGCRRFSGEVTAAAIIAFRDDFRGKGPEPVPL